MNPSYSPQQKHEIPVPVNYFQGFRLLAAKTSKIAEYAASKQAGRCGFGYLLCIAVVWCLFHIATVPAYAQNIDRADLINIDADTTVNFSGIAHNRRARRSTTNVSVTNTSGSAIDTPIILVIESISDESVTVFNADGTTTPDGKPLFEYSGQITGNTLDSSETSSTRPLIFSNPLLRRFSVNASVFQQTTSPPPGPVPDSVTQEIPTDSQGRKLIGVGEGITITIRADGTDPVTVDLGQSSAAAGSRGGVFFGTRGRKTSTTVTTSGGTSNTATIRARGNKNKPSAFHGDLNLTASVAGTEVASEQVTVVGIAVDLEATTLLNDMPVIRTITTTPPTSGLEVSFQTFRGRMEENLFTPILAAETFNSVKFTPLDGSDLTTDINGTVSFQMQAGYASQGWIRGSVMIESIGAETKIDADKSGPCDCDCCKPDVDPTAKGPRSVALFAGEKELDITDLSIPGRGFSFQVTRNYRSQVSHLRPIASNDFAVDWAISYVDDFLLQDGNNVVVFRSALRTDTFVATETPGEFLAPQEYYEQLRLNQDDNFEIRDRSGTIKTYKSFDDPQIPGRLIRMEDRNGNFMQFIYSQPIGLSKHVLTQVVETMGRNISYEYYAPGDPDLPNDATLASGYIGRLKAIEDFRRDNSASGRRIVFTYDEESNLISVTSPVVVGTPDGSNDFPNGKTFRYDYIRESDIPGGITGTERERRLHNLISIEYPNETAVDLDPGNPQTLPTPPNTKRETMVYGTDATDTASFDRVLTRVCHLV